MVVNCIFCWYFLENVFEDEMDIIVKEVKKVEGEVLYGILSLGEIFFYGIGLLDIFNKIIVVGIFSN